MIIKIEFAENEITPGVNLPLIKAYNSDMFFYSSIINREIRYYFSNVSDNKKLQLKL